MDSNTITVPVNVSDWLLLSFICMVIFCFSKKLRTMIKFGVASVFGLLMCIFLIIIDYFQ